MTESLACRECGTEVPYGRLSCPGCGELLATVVGAPRRAPPVSPAPPGPEHSPTDIPAGVAPDGAIAAAEPDDGLSALLEERDREPGHAGDRPLPAPASVRVAPSTTAWPVRAAAAASASAATATSAAMPGAWVPPVLQPAGPSAPARAWGGHSAPVRGEAVDDRATPVVPGTGGPTPPSAVDAGARIAIGSLARTSEFVGWLAIAGSALALVGFVLPWSSISVIGASGVEYFDRWGLAGAGHPLLALLVIALLAAAALRDRISIWYGIGLPALALGALLVGVAWPYVVGPLRGQLGVVAVAVGAVLLIVAGVATLVVDRHGRGDRPV